MLIEPNFSEVQDELAPGEYEVVITGSEIGEWQTGTKYVKWTFETVNEAEPKNNGRKVFDRTPISGKGAFRLQQLYKAATKQTLGGKFDSEQLHTCQLKVVVALNEQGYTDVKAYKPL